jgi:hypothetical protein
MRLLNCNQPFTIIVIDLFILLKKIHFPIMKLALLRLLMNYPHLLL